MLPKGRAPAVHAIRQWSEWERGYGHPAEANDDVRAVEWAWQRVDPLARHVAEAYVVDHVALPEFAARRKCSTGTAQLALLDALDAVFFAWRSRRGKG